MTGRFSISFSGIPRRALMGMAGITLLALCVSPAMAGTIHYGSRCQGTFQNGWAPDINVDPICSNFDSQIVTTGGNIVDFYFNLHGGENSLNYGNPSETCDSCGGADSVDFFIMSTHGTIASNNADWAGYAMWDQSCPGGGSPGCFAWTTNMRFGSQGKELKALATFSCDTLKSADGKLVNRWQSPFSGGLKVVVGGSELLWDDNTDVIGEEFAQLMQENFSIGTSWLNAVYNNDNDNNPAVANTGANKSACWTRQGVTLGNLMSESVLRDSQIGYYCWTWWGQP